MNLENKKQEITDETRCPECNSLYVYTPNPLTNGDCPPAFCEDCSWEGEIEELKQPDKN